MHVYRFVDTGDHKKIKSCLRLYTITCLSSLRSSLVNVCTELFVHIMTTNYGQVEQLFNQDRYSLLFEGFINSRSGSGLGVGLELGFVKHLNL